jgi:hypothetical protein
MPATPAPEPEDIYDIADDAKPAPAPRSTPAIPIAQPAATAPSVAAPRAKGNVLAYSSPAPRQVKSAAKGQFDPFDHFEGNRFKNLYLPLILIFGTAFFNVIAEVYFKHNASSGIIAASVQMVSKLAIEIPCMLIACVLAVKLLDAAFGPLGPAILKLSSIALAPDAIFDVMVFIAFLIGRATGRPLDLVVDLAVAALFGWLLSIVAYFWLFMYYFELEFGDVWKLAIFIWFVRMVLYWLIWTVFLSVLFH